MVYDNVIRCATKLSFVDLLNYLKAEGYKWKSGKDIDEFHSVKIYDRFDNMTTVVINEVDKWVMTTHYQFHDWNIGINNLHNIKEFS